MKQNLFGDIQLREVVAQSQSESIFPREAINNRFLIH